MQIISVNNPLHNSALLLSVSMYTANTCIDHLYLLLVKQGNSRSGGYS